LQKKGKRAGWVSYTSTRDKYKEKKGFGRGPRGLTGGVTKKVMQETELRIPDGRLSGSRKNVEKRPQKMGSQS